MHQYSDNISKIKELVRLWAKNTFDSSKLELSFMELKIEKILKDLIAHFGNKGNMEEWERLEKHQKHIMALEEVKQ
jgi:hypothetical protein